MFPRRYFLLGSQYFCRVARFTIYVSAVLDCCKLTTFATHFIIEFYN